MMLEEDIPEHHLVRFVNAAVNRLDDSIWKGAADPGWTSQNGNVITEVKAAKAVR